MHFITATRANLLTHLSAMTEHDSNGKCTAWATTARLHAVLHDGSTLRNIRNRLADAMQAGQVRALPTLDDGLNRYAITSAGMLALENHQEMKRAAEEGLRQKGTAHRKTGKGTIADTDFQRETVKSPHRQRIEALLKRLDDPEGLTPRQICAELGLTYKLVRTTINTAVNYGDLYNVAGLRDARYVHRDTWVRMHTARTDREEPIRNSNRPTGTLEYWKRHMAWQNTPARVELQA